MNNNASQSKKDSILKSLAIFGFIGIIVLIAWLSIQMINVLPGAFSSLASIADGLDQYKETINKENPQTSFSVTSDKTLVNTGESVEITWGTSNSKGSYVFTYICADGTAVDLLEADGNKSIDCDTNYNIGNVNNITMSVDSQKERYSLVQYSVSFLKTDETRPNASGEGSLTVFNNKISDIYFEEVESEVITPEEIADETTLETLVTETAPPLPKPETTTPTFTQEFTYTIPTTDPNGKTDLSIKFLNLGTIANNTFSTGQVKVEDEGAVQFDVKNYGTKTSEVWTYSLSLPNGSTYTSSEQAPLKPNERAVITIGFPTTENVNYTFKGSINESSDQNSYNNQFTESVTFSK